jgi:hypothetical protein
MDWQERVSGKRHQAASWRPRHSTSRPTTNHPRQDLFWRPRSTATRVPGALWEHRSSPIQWVCMGSERLTSLTSTSRCTSQNQSLVGGYPPGRSAQAREQSWTTWKSSQNLWKQVLIKWRTLNDVRNTHSSVGTSSFAEDHKGLRYRVSLRTVVCRDCQEREDKKKLNVLLHWSLNRMGSLFCLSKVHRRRRS